MESQLALIDQSFNARYSSWVGEALDDLPDNFTITDPCISGNPIVFASQGFLKMSGYSKEEVIGKNAKMLQGPGTNRKSIMEIREAIREERTIQLSLLNYRKDGTPFWMLFHLSPVFCKEDGRVIHFVAVQLPISRKSKAFTSGCGRNGCNFGEEGSKLPEIVFGSCRKEVCMDSQSAHLWASSSFDDFDIRGFDAEESCEASDLEKQKAVVSINNILSVLTHYSELTGKLVCGKRCNFSGTNPLCSSLTISLGRIKQSFVLTDPHLPDMPIVYASDAFLKLTACSLYPNSYLGEDIKLLPLNHIYLHNFFSSVDFQPRSSLMSKRSFSCLIGYARHEVLGKNCRFLNGPDTDAEAICQIRESIQAEQACTVRIMNYRKNGCSFWNRLHIAPVRNASGKIAFYVGVQTEEGCKNEWSQGLTPEIGQLGAVGAVKVAVRSLSMGVGPSKS